MRTLMVMTLLSGVWLRAEVEDKETFRQSFASATKLEVDNIHGFIHVTGYNGSEIRMVANRTIRADGQNELAQTKREVKLDTSNNGGTLKLYVDGPFRCNCSDGGFNWRDNHRDYSVRYDFEIEVPRSIAVGLRTVNG